jgi:hypothetical protein
MRLNSRQQWKAPPPIRLDATTLRRYGTHRHHDAVNNTAFDRISRLFKISIMLDLAKAFFFIDAMMGGFPLAEPKTQ